MLSPLQHLVANASESG